jgi:hypothetical protein
VPNLYVDYRIELVLTLKLSDRAWALDLVNGEVALALVLLVGAA